MYSMNPQILKAVASMRRETRFRLSFWAGIHLFLTGLAGFSHALSTESPIWAVRVPDDRIKVDGTPDTVWKAIAAGRQYSTIMFTDYGKIVILQPDAVRNDAPGKYIKPPATSYVTLMAAFDSKALYFYFQVKTATIANSKTLCADTAIWKADAAEVFIDPSPWNPDTAVYPSYFSADATNLIYGTSPKTVQLDKPLNDKDTRLYFRNRANADKFQIPGAIPTGVLAASLRNSKDTTLVSVEMKIPFWGGSTAAFAPGKSMFISWGFNMYPDSLWKNCTANPIAFRWAKNYLNYDNAAIKPPGWRAMDSTHYDPLRSWDGWGQFNLGVGAPLDPKDCHFNDLTDWKIEDWVASNCGHAATTFAKEYPRGGMRTGRTGASFSGAQGRDVSGRATQIAGYYIFPWTNGVPAPIESR